MLWVEAFSLFVVSHLVGDYLLQTDWQALNKYGGLGRDPEARRALLSHIATYTAAFLPALIWVGDRQGAATAVGIGAVIAIPHQIQDDGRLLDAYMRRAKGVIGADRLLSMTVDQSAHAVALLGAALLAAA